ncbi:uncharacterized protein BO66DRAFT_126045 [Aspergillus aculeatinus CBS 121060]|uniref:Uncharacterized protein n=1 Tax=Aspergillus aculeatinus CBS 121060 TaxID=1448322 RepID=A0ACD1H3X4_9EURO|nr:hypothetical protein BO66DRAFT_126045 [Aspergillus aculeatinus CBS 121060]RAH68477.1 hypothetical protein BO66DRAFT_126045 [Aspergillus aculeatinus CBS 121060]
MLVVKHQEIHLAHPQLSGVLQDLGPGSGTVEASTRILVACLKYLSSSEFGKWKEGPKRWATPELQDARFLDTEFNFAQYAALYLEQHFGSVVITEAIKSQVKEILTNPLSYRRIAVARWAASNLFERPDRCHPSVLPLMVGMRLHTWVLENPSAFPKDHTNDMSTVVSAAWEAARYRQRDLLKELLDH